MSYLLGIAAIGKALDNRNKAEARRRARAERERKAKENERNNYSHENTYEDYVLIEMACYDESLIDFFEKLKATADKLVVEESKQEKLDATMAHRLYSEEKWKRTQKESELKERGILVESICYGENPEYDKYTYNGLTLTKEMLESFDMSSFEREYIEMKNSNDSKFAEDESKLPKEIEKLERRMERFPFTRFLYEKKCREKKSNLNHIKYMRAREAELKSKYDIFKALSPEDKKEIISHMDLQEQCIKLYSEKIKKEEFYKKCLEHRVKSGSRKGYFDENGYQERLDKALKIMVETGELTEDDVISIIQKFDEIEVKSSNGEYENYSYNYCRMARAEKLKREINWFINNIRDKSENSVDKNKEDVDEEYSM